MEKINHGGEPTKNIDKKYAIFVGRYQPYHFGHIELIKQKLNQESQPSLWLEILSLMNEILSRLNKQ